MKRKSILGIFLLALLCGFLVACPDEHAKTETFEPRVPPPPPEIVPLATFGMVVERIDNDANGAIDEYRYYVIANTSLTSGHFSFPLGDEHLATCAGGACVVGPIDLPSGVGGIQKGTYLFYSGGEIIEGFYLENAHADINLFPQYAISLIPATGVVANPQNFMWGTSASGVAGDGWEGELMHIANTNTTTFQNADFALTQADLAWPTGTIASDPLQLTIASFITYARAGYTQEYWSVVINDTYTSTGPT